MVRRGLFPLLALSLAGCKAVGPDYRVPAAAAVDTPEAQGEFLSARSVTADAPLPDHWWQLFNDALLDGLITRALAANTDLRVADANLERSLALLSVRGADRDWQGNLAAETSYAQRSAEAELSHVQPPRRQIYNAGLAFSYDLDLFGGLRRGIEAASAMPKPPSPRAIWCASTSPPRPRGPMPISATVDTSSIPWSAPSRCWRRASNSRERW